MFPTFSNVASARESDFIAQRVWCGTAPLRFAVKHASLLFDEPLFFPDIYCNAKMSIAKANKRKYRKTASSMTLLASRKMDRISRKGVLCMKTMSRTRAYARGVLGWG